MQRLLFSMVCAALIATSAPAQAGKLYIGVDISSQRMVVKDGAAEYTWVVSTGRKGWPTPTGKFKVTRLEREFLASNFENAPMPYSVFINYRRGYAIHGTTEPGRLGTPVSHGCVRLLIKDAAKLFALVRK